MLLFCRNTILNIIYIFLSLLRPKKDVVLYQGSGKVDVFGNINAIKCYFDDIGYKYNLIYRPGSFIGLIYLIYILSGAKVFVYDSQNPCAYIKKRKTVFINCWHAVGAYKTLGFSAISKNDNKALEEKRIKRVFRGIDYWVCSSELQAKLYSESTKISNNHFLPIGIPRTDNIIRENNRKKKYTILYAPTFRGKKNRYVPKPFDITYFKETLGSKVEFAYRGHPTSPIIETDNTGWLNYNDMTYQELINIVDLVITDYSSIIFDFAIAGKPFILYTPDLNDYIEKDHPLYFYPSELSPNVANNLDELLSLLNHLIKERDKIETSLLVKDLIKNCDGNATKRVCNFIINMGNF